MFNPMDSPSNNWLSTPKKTHSHAPSELKQGDRLIKTGELDFVENTLLFKDLPSPKISYSYEEELSKAKVVINTLIKLGKLPNKDINRYHKFLSKGWGSKIISMSKRYFNS